MRIDISRSRTFGDVFNASFAFLRQNWGPMIKIVGGLVLPLFLIMGLMGFLLYDKISWMFNPAEAANVEPEDFLAIFSIPFAVYLLVAFAMGIMMYAGVHEYMAAYKRSADEEPWKTITLAVVWEKLRYSFWRVALAIVVLSLIALVVFGVLALVAGLLIGGLASVSIGLGVLVGMLVALVVIFAVLLFYAWSMMVAAVVVHEEAGVGTAISRANKLMMTRFWPTIGVVGLGYLISSVIGGAFSFIYYILMMFVGINSADGGEAMSNLGIVAVIVLILNQLINLLASMVPLTLVGFQYYSLHEDSGQDTLLDEISNIGADSGQ